MYACCSYAYLWCGRFNDPDGLLTVLDHRLNMLHRLGGEKLLAGFATHPRRDMLDNEKLSVVFHGISHFSLNHCFLHGLASLILPANPKVNPECRIRLVHRDYLNQWPRRVAALHMQRTPRGS